MGIAQQKAGQASEIAFAKFMKSNGRWVYRCPNNFGQPADFIIAYKDKFWLADSKHCDRDRFSTDRIEDNQRTAMDYFQSKTDGKAYFVIDYKDDFYILFWDLISARRGSVKVTEFAIPIEQALKDGLI